MTIKRYLPLNLQMFADNLPPEGDPKGDPESEKIEMTKEEYQKELQRESDRRVSEAIKKREEAWKAEFEERLEKERKEAEELAKLNEKERAEREFQKQREAFEAERKEFERKKLELDTKEVLTKEDLPSEFSSFVMGTNAESTLENINQFKTLWQKAIETEVNKRLATGKQKSGGSTTTTQTINDLSQIAKEINIRN